MNLNSLQLTNLRRNIRRKELKFMSEFISMTLNGLQFRNKNNMDYDMVHTPLKIKASVERKR